MKRVEIRKRQPLLHQGDVSKCAYFVESGCLRIWHNNDGADITVQFFVAGDIVASLESFMHEIPSDFSIEAVVPTVVREVNRSKFDALMARSPEFKSYMFDALVSRVADYQKLFLNRIMESPENRYRQLVEKDPQLFDIVPQHYLASYLGITPVSLSRIRKKVEKR